MGLVLMRRLERVKHSRIDKSLADMRRLDVKQSAGRGFYFYIISLSIDIQNPL